jgi:two-component system cell cycle sensor histidine kinase/response regulator CckA
VNQRLSRPRVLVVDDEPILRRFVAQILTAGGYEVLTAVDGREAHAIASHADAALDLVLTDIRMPHLDGLELGRALAALRPHLPVIYMSGFGEPVEDMSALRFIAKPFHPDQLLAEVHRVLPPSERRFN